MRPFGSALSWSTEETNLQLLIQVVDTLESDCPSRENILSDSWSDFLATFD
jgi:hypothetical protein